MDLCTSKKEYIDKIALSVQKVCKRYGYLPSVLIAQSCLENGYGVKDYFDNPGIELLLKYNNMVGIKSDLLTSSWSDKSVWPGKSLTKDTPEYVNGRKITSPNEEFRKYDNIEQSFADYLLFIKYASERVGGKPKYGDEILKIKDPAALINAVRSRGYATDPSYDFSVMKIVREHDLTKYDSLGGIPETTYVPGGKPKEDTSMDISINKKYITTNNTNSENNPIAIVIHNTDNFDKGADALAHAKALYQGDISGMSWHYAVDDHSIYQCVAHNRGAWHVGKNYGSGNLFGAINNRNSIGIEMCVNKGYDYEKAFQNTVALTKHLMKQLGIGADKVYQHYDICSKDCPSQIRAKGDWGRFKKLIGSSGSVTPIKEVKWYRVRKSADDEASQIEADEKLENAKKCADANYGYKVYDSEFNCVYDPFRWHFIDACQNVVDTARANGWVYGDSHATPPCSDKIISCDRLVARALYNLGYTDQRNGGETCGTLDGYLVRHGWEKVTDRSKIKPGAVITVRYQNHSYVDHTFVVLSYDNSTGLCTKFDTGSNTQIKSRQPFRNVPLMAWNGRLFVAAYNPPEVSVAKEEFFRVRKTASDEATQVGAYKLLRLAIQFADINEGYSVYDPSMKRIHGPSTKDNKETKYRVQVGIYASQDNAMRKLKEVRSKSKCACQVFLTKDLEFQVCCGRFKYKKNAKARADKLNALGIATIIEAP